jgi:hypothetical protein
MTVHDVARGAVDEDLLDPADAIERSAQCRSLLRWVVAPVAWVGQELGRILGS